MMRDAIFLIGCVVALGTMPAAAQPIIPCGDRATVVQNLAEIYGEEQQVSHPNDKGTVVYEFWASDTTGTWTLLMTTANGVSCIVAVGGEWTPEDDA